jgi:hypothetical protein
MQVIEQDDFEVDDIVEYTGDSCGLNFVRATVLSVRDNECSIEFFTLEIKLTVKSVPKTQLQRI